MHSLSSDPRPPLEDVQEGLPGGVSLSKVEEAIQMAIDAQVDNTPSRLLDTRTGRLRDRGLQITTFKGSREYRELLSFTTKHADLRMERIKDVVAMYFRYVMLSHVWEEQEPMLHDVQGKVVYELNLVGSMSKLQSLCTISRAAGYHWAWIDTCCIDHHSDVDVQGSANSMSIWYRHSALTIVYLSDVPSSSKSGALAKSTWSTRGWILPELLAARVVLFYQKDWTIYLDDPSPNHKESAVIMQELEDATGIDSQALFAFRPGMRGAGEILQWASKRITTLREDIMCSLCGIFDVYIPVICGERKENILGRFLQEVVAQSGDISALDWIGKSSGFNSCLPTNISSYQFPSYTPPSLSEDEMQASLSSLQCAVDVELALRLYAILQSLCGPQFASRRLRMPCIVFPVTTVIRRCNQEQETCCTYEVKADGLLDLLITTEDKLIQFSPARPTRQTFLLVRPWDRNLLELPDFADDDDLQDRSAHELDTSESLGGPHGKNELLDLDSRSQALRLIVRLAQPFGALLLAMQRGGQYKRVASDHQIIAQVKDITSVCGRMDVRTLEVL